MLNVNLDNPMEIQAVGMRVLREALGPVGMVRFIHQYDMGITQRKNRQSQT